MESSTNERQLNIGLYAIGTILIVASLAVRFFSYTVETNDYTDSLVSWFNNLLNPGLSAFQYPFSNYAPLYLYIIKFLTYIPINSLYTIKTVSVIFDIFLAWVAYKIVNEIKRDTLAFDSSHRFLIFAIVFTIPTVVFNSSLWAQCDVIYTSFVLLSLYYMMRNKPLYASLAFGIAISFKLQAIFFLPIILTYLIMRKRALLHMLLIPIVYLITIIPAIIGGGSFVRYSTIYFMQLGEYSALSLSAPSMYSFLNNAKLGAFAENILSIIGVVAALAAALFIGLNFVRATNSGTISKTSKKESIIYLSLMSVLIIPFLLPHMHDRYFYMADVFSVLFAIIYPRKWIIPLLVVLASFFSYMPFISAREPFFQNLIVNEAWLGLLILLAIVILVFSAKNRGVIRFDLNLMPEKKRDVILG